MKAQRRADADSYLTPRATTQAELLAQVPVVAGEPHPSASRAPPLSHNCLDAHLRGLLPPERVASDASAGFYDAASDSWRYPCPTNFKIQFPRRINLTGGEFLIVNSVDDLFRLVFKNSPECSCPKKAVGASGARSIGLCELCSFRTTLKVQRGNDATLSLAEAGYLSGSSGATLDIVSTLLFSSEHWPEYAGISRSTPAQGSAANAGRSRVMEKPPTSGCLVGANFAFGVSCSAPGCPGCAFLCASTASPLEAEARFEKEHIHPALACLTHNLRNCKICPAAGLFPLAAPFGRLAGTFGAFQLHRMQQLCLASPNSPTVLWATRAAELNRMELLCGNRSRCGSDVSNWERVTSKERERCAARNGVQRVLVDAPDIQDISVATTMAKLVCRSFAPVN